LLWRVYQNEVLLVCNLWMLNAEIECKRRNINFKMFEYRCCSIAVVFLDINDWTAIVFAVWTRINNPRCEAF